MCLSDHLILPIRPGVQGGAEILLILFFHPEDGGSRFRVNSGIYLPAYCSALKLSTARLFRRCSVRNSPKLLSVLG
jgi:hypothetical protein